MTDFIDGTASQLSPVLLTRLFNYRYKVFVETLGWTLPCKKQLEIDAFDHKDTCYVLALDSCSVIIGCARLLPTSQPYLLSEIFPELLNGMDAPSSPDVWELSRFTSMDPRFDISQLPLERSRALLIEAMKVVKRSGGKSLISVSPIGVERLLRRVGIQGHRIGPPCRIDGHSLIACWIELAQNEHLLENKNTDTLTAII